MSWSARIRARAGALVIDVDLHGADGPLALVGPNGSGKTTLLRILAGAHPLDEGRIEVGGSAFVDTARRVDTPPERRGVGYVPQGHGLFPHLTVVDNVAFGLSTGPRKLGRQERTSAALQALEELGCASLAARKPARLSGGERQRVALARALVTRPGLLLLDEPLAALDAAARRAVRTLLAERLRSPAGPSVIVTHDVRDVAALDAPVVVLESGRIVQRGTLDELRAAPETAYVAEYVGA